ncbi:MAG: YdeI/OmpD-associated family protein [Litorilinea sp.]
MRSVEITQTLHVTDRVAWRQWLMDNHKAAREIWLVSYKAITKKPRISYLDSVEEALCFGWIDGIAKSLDAESTAQRFTPRRPNSHWTELNKERARRLIAQGLMTEAGFAALPDLSLEAFSIPPDILEALQADSQIWANFQAFPPLYQRIRISYINEQRRNPTEFDKRLHSFLKRTRENKMFGQWRD